MMTISQYAKSRGVSFEAVRRQIKKYDFELSKHIRKEGRTRYLDDLAVMFLDEHRAPKSVVISDTTYTDEINALKNEVDKLRDELIAKQEHIIRLQEDKAELLEVKGKYTAMIEDKEHLQQKLADAQADIQNLKADASLYQKTVFGLYRKLPPTTNENAPKNDLND